MGSRMKKYREDEQPAGEDRPLTVRVVESPAEVQKILAFDSRAFLLARSAQSSSSAQGFPLHVIGAFDGDRAVGFAAFKAMTGAIRVSHELWVDPRARFGVAPVAAAILVALESAVRATGCSRLFVLVGESMPLRKALQDAGYVASLTNADLVWFEKGLVVGPDSLESA
jgi:hypothetical protein